MLRFANSLISSNTLRSSLQSSGLTPSPGRCQRCGRGPAKAAFPCAKTTTFRFLSGNRRPLVVQPDMLSQTHYKAFFQLFNKNVR
jgi:hypothetical protein